MGVKKWALLFRVLGVFDEPSFIHSFDRSLRIFSFVVEGLLCLGFGRVTYLSGWRGCVYYFRRDGEAKTAERPNQSIENIDSTLLPSQKLRSNPVSQLWGFQISITKNYSLTHASSLDIHFPSDITPSVHPPRSPTSYPLTPTPQANTCNPTRETHAHLGPNLTLLAARKAPNAAERWELVSRCQGRVCGIMCG